MTQKKAAIRDYNFSDGELKQKADGIVLNIQRTVDVAKFSARGVTPATITAFQAQVTDFDLTPSDEILLGKVSIATENKNALAEQLRVAIRTIRSMAENKWGVKNAAYRIYKFENLNETPDETLHRLARTVLLVAPTQLAALAGEGLTQAMIANIETIDTAFDGAIDVQIAAIRERDINSQDRIDKGNLVYKELTRLCNIGKDLFASTDQARYNDYIIYNTPTGQPPAEGEQFGSAHGSVLSGATLAAVVNGLVFLEGIEEPIEVDQDSNWECDQIPITCTKISATADGCIDYQAPITIIAGEDITFDIMMEPGTLVPPGPK